MSKTILEPIIVSNDVIVQFTDTITIDKKLYITVPASYKAIIFVDEEPISRIDECNNQSIFKKLDKNKSYLNHLFRLSQRHQQTTLLHFTRRELQDVGLYILHFTSC